MTVDELSIEMLPARHGDALWIEWGDESDRHRMLVDAGPAGTIKYLRRRFEALDETERHLDLFVVTHIDADHIDGAIRLLDDKSLGVRYSDIWFNDHHHLAERPGTRGAMQGEFLGGLLDERDLPWNVAFDGDAVVVPPNGSLPSVNLPGGLRLVLVSPTPAKLDSLRTKWEKVIAEAGMEPGDREEALDRLDERLGRSRGGGDRATFGGDSSEANGSSIAFIAEYRDERWLLAGDAHDDVLIEGLRRYAAERGESPVRLDGFKLPHHGSVRNISPALLDEIRCRRFLVSTDGSYFKHPDQACIDLVVRGSDRPELIFNYRTEFNEKWAAPSADHVAIFPDGGDGHAAGTQSTTPTAVGADAEVARPEREASVDTATGEATSDPTDESASTDAPPEVGDADAGGESGNDRVASGGHGTTPPRESVAVTVYHGSLERADDPVLVGHYLGTPLSGAEGFADRRFLGRLSDRFARGGYPGDVGQSLWIRAARRRHPQSGVIVVGLGEYGELTPLRLVATVRQALIEHALDEADRRDETGVVQLGIGSVLLGATGDQGVSISATVRAVVTAVREANLELRDPHGGRRVRYANLTIWERNGAEAELAFRALHALEDDAPSHADAQALDGVLAAPDLCVAGGALRNGLRVDSEQASWWRVRVRELGDPSHDDSTPTPYLRLEFSVGGRLARTGNVVHLVERRRLERLLREMVADSKPGSGLHVALFELLFPNELKWEMTAAQDIQLEVDDLTADIPWEMLAARNPGSGRGQLALRAPMVRQLRLAEFRAIQRATSPTALVIGNPPAGRLGPPLQGAYDEAIGVVEVLSERGYEVTAKCYPTSVRAGGTVASDIETTLLAEDHRIIHIAAHGLFQPDDPTRSGVVIGPDEFLTAQLLGQVDITPDLVFLNCCHLGSVAIGLETGAIEFTRQNLNRLGASLARRLIDAGVRSVVVAGWAVDDTAAGAFARTFYEAMLDGAPFGSAVHEAREAAYDAAPEHSTWGAYQCYGDGGYRLPRDVARPAGQTDVVAPITAAESQRRIESLVSALESVGIEADHEHATAELEMIEHTARTRRWLEKDDGSLCEDLATGWAAIGDFARAIERLDEALGSGGGGATLGALEQRANLKGRLAARLLRSADSTDADRRRAQDLMAQALDSLSVLETISQSGERLALRAGHHKRLAAATSGAERSEALHRAAEGYRKAFERDEADLSARRYTLLNHVQLEEIRSRVDGDDSKVRDLRAEVAALIDAPDEQSSGDYWTAVRSADSALTLAIIDDRVPRNVDDLVLRYETVFDSQSTAKQRSSSLDHLLDLADLHPDPEQSAAILAVHRALTSDSG